MIRKMHNSLQASKIHDGINLCHLPVAILHIFYTFACGVDAYQLTT